MIRTKSTSKFDVQKSKRKNHKNKKVSELKQKITVIIPTYNRYQELERAIHSVTKQQEISANIIVIDDGSDDKNAVRDICLKFNNVILYSQKHKGVSEARNKGITMCKTKYIAFLDSDDEFEVNRISKTIQLMQSHNATLSICNRLIRYSNGKIQPDKEDRPTGNYYRTHWFKQPFPLSASSIIAETNSLKCRFDPELPASNDIDFIIRSIGNNTFLWIAEALVIIHKDYKITRISSNLESRERGLQGILRKKSLYLYGNSQELIYFESRIRENLGMCYFLTNRPKKARNEWKQISSNSTVKKLFLTIVSIITYSTFLSKVASKIILFFLKNRI